MRDFDPTVRSVNEGLSGNPLRLDRIDKIIGISSPPWAKYDQIIRAGNTSHFVYLLEKCCGGLSDGLSFTDHNVDHSYKIIFHIYHSTSRQNLGPFLENKVIKKFKLLKISIANSNTFEWKK